MKINSMKLMIISMLMCLMAGVIVGLFFISIPEGNSDVAYMLLGILANDLGHAINNMFKKEI